MSASLAKRALAAGTRVLASPSPRRRPRRAWLLLLAGTPAVLLVALVMGVALLAGALQEQCATGPGADAGRPGALGGVSGTGLTRAQLERVRTGSPYASDRAEPGQYVSTSYGPPWGGIQGQGVATSGGLRINGGRPRWYMVAVDPVLVGHGQLIYLWPNPFNWRGPFLAADTGGAITQRRIDFYDWRGRTHQHAWGRRTTTLTLAPRDAGPPLEPFAAIIPTDCSSSTGAAAQPRDGALALPGTKGRVRIAPLANASGHPVRRELLRFLEAVAGIAGRELVLTTGTNHSRHTSSGRISDHVLGLAADFGSVANQFPLGGGFGTRLAAAALRAAGLPEHEAFRLARAGGGHNRCHQNWRVQVIWRTGGHHDHVHIGLNPGCQFTGVQTFQIP